MFRSVISLLAVAAIAAVALTFTPPDALACTPVATVAIEGVKMETSTDKNGVTTVAFFVVFIYDEEVQKELISQGIYDTLRASLDGEEPTATTITLNDCDEPLDGIWSPGEPVTP